LSDDHDLSSFDCGVPSLNGWLRDQSQRARLAGTARTQVWTPQGSNTVVAYYSIAPTQVIMKVSTAQSIFQTGMAQVTADRGAGLGSIVLSLPDGSQESVVVSPDERRALADHLMAESGHLDLREAIRVVLGRDPFAEG